MRGRVAIPASRVSALLLCRVSEDGDDEQAANVGNQVWLR